MPNPDLDALNATILGPQGAAPAAAGAAPAAAQGAPEAAAGDDIDQMLKDMIDIDMGEKGGKRQLTKKQIASMVERYGEASSQLDENSPVLALVSKIREASPNASPEQIAQFLAQAAQSYKPDGKKAEGDGKPAEAAGDPTIPSDDDLTKWEKENAASLPPGYRQIGTLMQQLVGTIAQQQDMLKQVLQASAGAAHAAGKLTNDAVVIKNTNARERVGMNLDRAQAQLELTDDDAQPFMAFALDRGYVPEDFGRFDLVVKVMTDFKATKALPEFDRLKKIVERRQAFSGSLGAQPQSQPGKPAAGSDTTFNALVDQQMAKRI